MRVLHMFSNKRWTGPAEPAANLAAGLQDAGVEVTFACGTEGDRPPHQLAAEARARGLEVRTDLELPKHFHPLAITRDATHLARDLRQGHYDLLHCHMAVDHCTAALARQTARTNTPIVRSVYDGVELRESWASGLAVRRSTDALCVASAQVRDNVVRRKLLPDDRVHIVDGAVDTDRFTRNRPPAEARTHWDLGPEHVVFGVVARLQPYRRFDVLFRAFRTIVDRAPHARLLVVGRGTREEEVARRPVRQLGLTDQVRFAGYLHGDAYVAALCAMDALVFLMPGSDGTCRAVREALAMGVPVVAARRGILPWLVADGESGLVVDDSLEDLAAALSRFATDDALRSTLAAGAARQGGERFGLQRQVQVVQDVYRLVTGG